MSSFDSVVASYLAVMTPLQSAAGCQNFVQVQTVAKTGLAGNQTAQMVLQTEEIAEGKSSVVAD